MSHDLWPEGFGRSSKRKEERPDVSPYQNGLKVSDHSCPECGEPGWDAAIYPGGGICDNSDCIVNIYDRNTGEVINFRSVGHQNESGDA